MEPHRTIVCIVGFGIQWCIHPYTPPPPSAPRDPTPPGSQDASEAIAFVDESAEPYPFIVQRYLDRPFLIGGRKFDLRVWAVLTPAFDIHVYREVRERGMFGGIRVG